ncbi:MAG: o-succinylbenzoate synthase [Myxococcus sp.]|nr:o-succinylbenzoate synthase [Myxococcus sp.]
MKFEITRASLRLARRVTTSRAVLHEREGLQVTISGDGVSGRGETFPLPAFGTEPLGQAEAAIRAFAPQPFAAVEELTLALAPLEATPAARFAVECALLEWLARRRGIPVALLLGEGRADVAVNALIEGADAASLADEAKRAVDAGFRTLKIKVGSKSVSVDAQRLHAVRLAVGAEVALRIDANGGWSEGTARSTLRGLESLALELCEQPVAAHDVEALRRLAYLGPVPIAVDEGLADASLRARLLEADPRPAAHVLVLKPAVLGGLVPALALARAAAEVGVAAYVTTMLDGSIARAAATHLAAVLPAQTHAHGLSTVELFEGAGRDAFTPKGGVITLPDSAGWGV